MTYIPVGTYLTYTAQVQANLTSGYTSWEQLSAALKNDLPNLPGLEELDVESANGNDNVLSISGTFSISMQILNNGVDHSSETDVQSIIDGTIHGYGNTVVSSNIASIQLPNNPTPISTGATPNVAAPSTAGSGTIGSLLPSVPAGQSVLGTLLGTTGTLTGGLVILLVLIVALILLFPSGFGRALRATR